MNNDLNETNPPGTFVTSIVGCYNIKTDVIDIANAAIGRRIIWINIPTKKASGWLLTFLKSFMLKPIPRLNIIKIRGH